MSPSHPRFAMETPSAKHAEIIDTTIGQQLTKIIAEWFKRNELVLASENWPSVPSWLLFGYVSESSGIDLCAKPLTDNEDDLLRRGLLRLKFGKIGIPKMVGHPCPIRLLSVASYAARRQYERMGALRTGALRRRERGPLLQFASSLPREPAHGSVGNCGSP